MPTLEHAIELAVKAHHGQQEKNGQPYILYPLRVMFQLNNETDMIVGILHDVIEDSDYSFDDLRGMGYSEEILSALDGITRREDESYEEFVARSQANPISKRVKLADLTDNMNIKRLNFPLTEWDFKRLQRYRKAWKVLNDE